MLLFEHFSQSFYLFFFLLNQPFFSRSNDILMFIELGTNFIFLCFSKLGMFSKHTLDSFLKFLRMLLTKLSSLSFNSFSFKLNLRHCSSHHFLLYNLLLKSLSMEFLNPFFLLCSWLISILINRFLLLNLSHEILLSFLLIQYSPFSNLFSFLVYLLLFFFFLLFSLIFLL